MIEQLLFGKNVSARVECNKVGVLDTMLFKTLFNFLETVENGLLFIHAIVPLFVPC